LPLEIQDLMRKAQLFSLPDIYLRLRDLLSEPDYALAEVVILVGQDPALATRFLRIANSPLNHRANKIETVSHAVSMLGAQQVHDIVLSASIADTFAGIMTDVMNMRQFWQRSVYCAVTTQQLGAACGEMNNERLFVMGLLHDVGHLLMYVAFPEVSQQLIRAAKESDQPLYKAERELLGFDYAQLGGDMMQHWDLPTSLQATTRFHPEAMVTNQFSLEINLLHLSSLLIRSDLEDGDFARGAYAVTDTAWEVTGLTVEKCLETRQTAFPQFEDIANSLYN